MIVVKKLRPYSEKHAIVQIAIGSDQTFWSNYSAFCYYVDFDAVYARVDATLLVGVSAQSITGVSGVSSDSANLLEVASIATCEATELSFYYDALNRALYIHLQYGDPPSLHKLIIGVVYGVANHAGTWGGTYYEPRLRSAPAIAKSIDPMFFCVIAIDGWLITIDNTPDPGYDVGPYDSILKDFDVFGNRVKSLVGFDGDAYADFYTTANGFIENVTSGRDELTISAKDLRRALRAKIPTAVFDVATYPNILPGNIGKYIPVGYGVIKNAPVTCTNEAESPAPVSYSFKICDTTKYAIHAITTVYVEHAGVRTVRVPATTNLTTATFTFTVASGFYVPGDVVTVDYSGYKDALGALIQNSISVMQDLMTTWAGMVYLPETFNQGEWTTAKATAPNIGIFIDDEKEILDAIQDICFSAQVNLIPQDDGRFTARRHNPYAPYTSEIKADEILPGGLSPITADPTEVISSARVGHSKNWASDTYQYILDASKDAEVFARYKTRNQKTFDTLLTSAADAQSFATYMLAIGAYVARIFSVRTKMQHLGKELMDIVRCPYRRRSGLGMIGDVRAEVIGVSKNFDSMEIELTLRIIEVLPVTIYVQGGWYGYGWYGYNRYSKTGEQVVT
jgi:hypothetical protein